MSKLSPQRLDRLGPYTLMEHLADGGMGSVWLACEGLGGKYCRLVAVKVSLIDHPEFNRRFTNEAVLQSWLRHENLVTVYSSGLTDGVRYLAMELVEGINLTELMRSHGSNVPLDPWIAAYIVAEAAAGLHHAHTLKRPTGEPLGVVHRDVSFSNILVTLGGRVKVIDFGAARYEDRLEKTSGEFIGKHVYASPEHIRGLRLDARADVWSLGVVFWQLLSGRFLFGGSVSPNRVPRYDKIPPPLSDAASPGKYLNPVVRTALQPERTRRYPSALALREGILEALSAWISPANALRASENLQTLLQTSCSPLLEQLRQRRERAVFEWQKLGLFDAANDPQSEADFIFVDDADYEEAPVSLIAPTLPGDARITLPDNEALKDTLPRDMPLPAAVAGLAPVSSVSSDPINPPPISSLVTLEQGRPLIHRGQVAKAGKAEPGLPMPAHAEVTELGRLAPQKPSGIFWVFGVFLSILVMFVSYSVFVVPPQAKRSLVVEYPADAGFYDAEVVAGVKSIVDGGVPKVEQEFDAGVQAARVRVRRDSGVENPPPKGKELFIIP